MNYSKQGITKRKHQIRSFGTKVGKKLSLYLMAMLIVACIALGILGVCAGVGVLKGIIASSPDITNIDVSPTGFSTFVYDSEGNQTAKLVATDSNRIPVTLDQVPINLQHAFIAIEDSRFYVHNGIDIKGITRAVYDGIKKKFKGMQGASTITQQLLKNNVFKGWTDEDSFREQVTRKIQEQYLAIELEKVMDKDKILENYMNTINLGQNTLGVQAASLRYFNKDVSELNLTECAVIAAITQNPSRYNPISHPENNKERRDKVLKDMCSQGYITEEEKQAAMNDNVYERIQVTNNTVEEDTINSYFDDAVTEAVYDDLLAAGYSEQQAYTLLYTGGLSIFSTQDPRIQKICDEVFSDPENYPSSTRWLLSYALTIEKANGEKENHSTEMFKTYFKQSNAKFDMLYSSQEDAYAAIEEYKAAVMSSGDEELAETISLVPQPQISFTIEDQSNGYVLAMIGGRGEKTASRTLNRATSTTRQPGSTFKVLSAFAPALDSAGLTLATVQNDAPYTYDDGKPVSNWWGKNTYKGIQSIRDGIRESMNIVAVKTLTQITPQLGYDYLLDFGFTTLETGRVINGKVYSDITQALALGGITNGVTNLELNAAYATIANQGTYIKPKLYTKVVDHDGKVILDNTTPVSHQVLKPTTAWLLTSAMKDVVTSGTGTKCRLDNVTVAGKTGTTSDYRDIWFSGFTPYYTATTWAGYDNNAILPDADHNLTKTLWKAVMSRIHEGMEDKPFPTPAGIVTATVCSRSGKLPIPGLCDACLKTEYFEEGTVPTATCDVHYSGIICAYDNLPASENCPFKVEGVFELPLPEDPAVAKGSATIAADGSIVQNAVRGSVGEDGVRRCSHDALFFADPNHESIIAQQQWELQAAAEAAFAAQQAANEATDAENNGE